MMPPEDVAAIRGLLQEALRPYEGLPATAKRLADELLEVRQLAADLKQQLEHHSEQLSSHRIQLRDSVPALEGIGDLAGKVDVLIPRVERALDRLDAVQEQATDAAERRKKLERSVESLEQEFHERERATGNGQ